MALSQRSSNIKDVGNNVPWEGQEQLDVSRNLQYLEECMERLDM
jgi:hypothetical protein